MFYNGKTSPILYATKWVYSIKYECVVFSGVLIFMLDLLLFINEILNYVYFTIIKILRNCVIKIQ